MVLEARACAMTYTELFRAKYERNENIALSMSNSEFIVWEIVNDLSDRRGLSHEWNGIEPGIQDEIFEAWVAIARGRP